MKTKTIDYKEKYIKSLERENSLLRSMKLPTYVMKESEDSAPTIAPKGEPKLFGTYQHPIYDKYIFNNGEEYEIAKADDNGVLVFRDAVFESEFDDSDKCTNVWEKCSLKKKLEKWFKENAPKELQDKYSVDLLADYEIFDKEQLSEEYIIGEQLDMFKDWHNRVKGVKGQNWSTWWWTKTAYRGYVHYAIFVGSYGTRDGYYAGYSYGVVPCLRPKH